MGLDPIYATNHLRQSYLRYLATAFPLKDSALAAQFRALICEPERLVKGPYLEATPPFRTSASIGDLIREGALSRNFQRLDSHLPVNRPLYDHQAQAIRKVAAGRNVVIATGTGSGKTEAFLIPVLNLLFRELESNTLGPGVRALLLYPMNALANDQLKRLRRLLAGAPEITFGRYTGETESSRRAAEEQFHRNHPGEPRLPNELLSREEMQQNPPHILLTNYAMLEYLLLRPEDSVLFDGEYAKNWRFLVLDEAHTYNGAVGIEIAMLLRRLADRVMQSERGRLRCVATSATLGGGPGDFEKVARFASQLFSERFDPDDVVDAARVPLSALGEGWGSPDPALYRALLRATDANASSPQLLAIARRCGVPESALSIVNDTSGSDSTARLLYEVLRGDARLITLRQALEVGPLRLDRVAERVIGRERAEDLVALVALAARARAGEDDLPLLPARYHVFVRALEGAYVGLGERPQLYLDRMLRTPGEETGVAFEAATCKRCGQLYLVGTTLGALGEQPPRLMHPPTLREDDSGPIEFYRLLSPQETSEIPDDEDEVVASEDDAAEQTREQFTLCAGCGAIRRVGELGDLCDCGSAVRRWAVERVPSRDRQVNHCRGCGTRSPALVLRFLTGQDAPASVLATAVYQALPPAGRTRENGADDDWNLTLPRRVGSGDGRKLLIFSDSRQDAAFFACYLDRTYSQILRRRLVTELLSDRPEIVRDRWRIQDLVDELLPLAERRRLFAAGLSRRQRRSEAWKWILLELLATDRRHGLEGVGLLGFELARPQAWRPPGPLMQAPWALTTDEVWTLYQVLLDSFRLQQAITFPDGVSVADPAFAPRNRELYFRQQGSSPKRGIFSWGAARPGCWNRRLDFLAKLNQACTEREAPKDVAQQLLSDLWSRSLTAPNSVFRDYLEESRIEGEGVVHRLRHEFFELAGFGEGGWFRCDRCGGLTRLCVRNVCPTYRCDGRLHACNPDVELADDHYRRLYLDSPVVPLVVEEHTAQLTADAAAKLQEQFVQGEVNVLSSSTTFELGVDVGELEVVFLRNVPPETANYVQRAGRAGRRTEATAFAVTFCQRRSHDLSYYREPERMIAGRIEPPYFELRNEKIVRRHIQAVALARFLREAPQLFGKVSRFFLDGYPPTAGPERFEAFLQTRPVELHLALGRIVPQGELHDELQLEAWGWLRHLFDLQEGSLRRAADELRGDVQALEERRQELAAAQRPSDHILRALNTIRDRQLIEYLANRGVLPKYGFPVDVVELNLAHRGEAAGRLELERDLRIAISEYAPESEVVAGGFKWRSYALKSVPNHAWPCYNYGTCRDCGFYVRRRAETDGAIPSECQSCGGTIRKGTFIVPRFGFQTAWEEPDRPDESRPERTYSSRVFFTGEMSAAGPTTRIVGSGVTLEGRPARHGRLAVINRAAKGARFRICERCGFGVRSSTRNVRSPHRTPWGQDCAGVLQYRDLGHEFETDIFELRVDGYAPQEPGFWLSALYALLEGTSKVLNVRRQDLDGCLFPHRGRAAAPAMILFDDVPGGAGHVRRLGEHLHDAIAEAIERVDGQCECGGGRGGLGDTSCYGCLRNYRNQFCHNDLRRGDALKFWRHALSLTAP